MKATVIGIKIKYFFYIIDFLLIPVKFIFKLIFLITRKPFGLGYELYKWQRIKEELLKINKFKKNNFLNFRNVSGLDERIVEYSWIFYELKNIKGNLLDAGSTLNFSIILDQLKTRFNIFIQTLFPENICNYEDGISYLYTDLTKKIFIDNYFDVITCISTLEHVGFDVSIYSKNILKKKNIDSNSYLKVVKDFRRILKKNGILLLTLPFGKKESFQELQQFDKQMIDNIIKNFRPSKFEKRFAVYKDFSWRECNEIDCKNIRFRKFSNKKSYDNAASARSIILLKLVK